jgi:hypothetical protein
MTHPIVTIDSFNRTWVGGRLLTADEARRYWLDRDADRAKLR